MNNIEQADNTVELVKISSRDGVLTIMMNQPKKLNGWTADMIDAIKEAFSNASKEDSVKAVVFTGSGDYFSAGANLGGALKLMSPKTLHEFIVTHNQQLFEAFLRFPKPILVAVNGPALGASVTSATLCNGIIAADDAFFPHLFLR